jgi:hypothetical protein
MAVSVEIVSDPTLNEGIVPYLSRFPSFVNLCDILIHVTTSVHSIPKGFSICWVITTAEVLLITVIEEWNTSCSHCKHHCSFEACEFTWPVC